MTSEWRRVRFAEFLRLNKRPYNLGSEQDANLVGMRWYGEGPFHRELKPAIRIGKKSHFIIKEGDVVYNKLFAWKGTFGVVPRELSGMFVSDKFPTYELDRTKVDEDYLRWYFRCPPLWDEAKALSTGSAALSKLTLNPPKFPLLTIPLPSLAEQRRVATRINEFAAQIDAARGLRLSAEIDLGKMLLGAFNRIADGAPTKRMQDIAPIIRRPVEIDPLANYPELGIRSFGKGTFHKPALSGIEVGSKRMYRIELEDLLFSNVFAWEGAIAVVRKEDSGRYGSHRFIACVPKVGVATSEFLCFYFLTAEGLRKIGRASPGGAGRNRTLGLEALSQIEVPVPSFEKQKWFTRILQEAEKMRRNQAATKVELEAVIPSILDRAFRGEL